MFVITENIMKRPVFHRPGSSASLVVAITLKVTEEFRGDAMMLFYTQQIAAAQACFPKFC